MNQQISKAMDAHQQWKDNLYKAIESGSINKSIEDIKADNKCAFGQWLYGNEISEDVKNTAIFQEVKKYHAEFHVHTAKIAEMAIGSQKEEALEELEMGSEYSSLSMDLISKLSDLDKLF